MVAVTNDHHRATRGYSLDIDDRETGARARTNGSTGQLKAICLTKAISPMANARLAGLIDLIALRRRLRVFFWTVSFVGVIASAFASSVAVADTLDVDPAAPLWVHALATAVLYLHIGGGAVGLISGAAALTFRKGERLHRMTGTVFFIAMLTSAGIAAPVAVLMGDRVNVVAGVLTLYLVTTAWATVRRKEGCIGRFEIGAMFIALGVAAAGVIFILQAAASPTGTINGQPPQANYLFAGVASLAALGDLHMMLRRGISGAQRIARHLWRMCFALFVASGSLFLGQAQVFPESLRESPLLIVLALAPLAFLIFWMLWVQFTKAFKAAPQAP